MAALSNRPPTSLLVRATAGDVVLGLLRAVGAPAPGCPAAAKSQCLESGCEAPECVTDAPMIAELRSGLLCCAGRQGHEGSEHWQPQAPRAEGTASSRAEVMARTGFEDGFGHSFLSYLGGILAS